QATELLAPPVIRKLRHADQTDRFSDRTTLRQQNIDLAQLRHDLFGFVLLLGHSNVLLRLNSLLQGGPLFRGQTSDRPSGGRVGHGWYRRSWFPPKNQTSVF